MEALTVGFCGNEYASGSCIGKQEIEGFNRVFFLQLAKAVKTDTDSLRTIKEVPDTFGVLSLFRVIINCNSARRISNKSSVRSRTHKLFVALPGNTPQYYYLFGLVAAPFNVVVWLNNGVTL
jgi:hypothetical protein